MGKNLKKDTNNLTKSTLDPLGKFTSKDTMTMVAASAEEMPEPDADAVKAARRRKVAEMQNRGGRASTFMSEDRLGG